MQAFRKNAASIQQHERTTDNINNISTGILMHSQWETLMSKYIAVVPFTLSLSHTDRRILRCFMIFFQQMKLSQKFLE